MKIKDFHRSVPEILSVLHLNLDQPLSLLELQNKGYKYTLNEVVSNVAEVIQSQQKEINRSFKPSIAEAMLSAYSYCVNESGPGSQKRMTEHMKQHVEKERPMFREATRRVQTQLDEMLGDVKRHLKLEVDKIHVEISRSYIATFCKDDLDDASKTDARQVFAATLGRFLDLCRQEFDGFSEQVPYESQSDGEEADEEHGRGLAGATLHDDVVSTLRDTSIWNFSTNNASASAAPTSSEIGLPAPDMIFKQEEDDSFYAATLQAEEDSLFIPDERRGYRQVGTHLVIDD